MEKTSKGKASRKMRTLFFGTSEFAIYPLKALIDSSIDIVGVVSTPDRVGRRGKKVIKSPVKILAEEYAIDVYQPEKLKTKEAFNIIAQFEADIFVVVSYGKFLPDDIITIPPYKAINIHPSLLPKYRGPSPINYALLNGDEYTGVSIIDVSSVMDAGDVYMQWVEKIYGEDNYKTLYERLSKIGAKMVVCAIENMRNGNIKPKKQNGDNVTFTKIIDKSNGKINFHGMDAKFIVNMVRAYYGWPTAYFHYNDKIFKIYEAEIKDIKGSPSTVLKSSKKEFVIGCKNGSVSIKKIQPESKKPMDIRAFLAGYKIEVGEIIE